MENASLVAERTRYSIREVRLDSGVRIPVLCCDGLPVYGSTFWTLGQLQRNSYNTMQAKLRVVGHWLAFCDVAGLDWSDRVRTGKFLTPGEISKAIKWMGIAIHLHVQPTAKPKLLRVATHIQASRVGFLRHYLCWLAERSIPRMQPGDDKASVIEAYAEWMSQWTTTEKSNISAEQPPSSTQGLTQDQRDLFLTVVKPGDPNNPFEPGMQIRNYSLLMMLYEHGMRMSESLLLRTDDVHFDTRLFDVAERVNDPHDTRGRAPGSKMQGRTSRQRMFSQVSMGALEQWLHRDRVDPKRFPGAKKCPFVFISERGNPLSVRRLSYLFEILRKAFPEKRDGHRLIQVGFNPTFSPHDLRHDWNIRFVLANYKNWTEQHDRTQRYEMGWSKMSKMPAHYSRVALRVLGGFEIEKISAERTYEAMKLRLEMPF